MRPIPELDPQLSRLQAELPRRRVVLHDGRTERVGFVDLVPRCLALGDETPIPLTKGFLPGDD